MTEGDVATDKEFVRKLTRAGLSSFAGELRRRGITRERIMDTEDTQLDLLCDEISKDTGKTVSKRRLRRFMNETRPARRRGGVDSRTATVVLFVLAATAASFWTPKSRRYRSADALRSLLSFYSSSSSFTKSSNADVDVDELDRNALATTRVVCAGGRRSGSTWQYHAVRLILTLANPDRQLIVAAYSGDDPEEAVSTLETNSYAIVKIHEYHPSVASAATHVFTAHRDPRDVLHSVKRTGMAWEATKIPDSPCASNDNICAVEAFWTQYERWAAWSNPSGTETAYDMPYERLVDGGEIAEIRRLIDRLGFPHVHPETVLHGLRQVRRRRQRIDVLWDVPPSRERRGDSSSSAYTHMRRSHIKNPLPGAGRGQLRPSEIRAVERRLGDRMRAVGYEVVIESH